LPASVRACLFDLDGVLTMTATLHSAAWKEMFDAYLRERAARLGEEFRAFETAHDYVVYIDGRHRADGVRSFLASRGIELPEGDPRDPPDAETVAGLGNRKNERVVEMMRQQGVRAFEGSVRFVEAVRAAGLRTAVVSASANCAEALAASGIAALFDERVDAVVAEELHLRGKPAPDTYLAAARLLGVDASEAAVFEDALAGVEAGRAGRFGLVVGVDRVGQADALRAHGADVVVADLAELLAEPDAPA
jgi:beta-phosphoglucomutase family hydrolase